MPCKMYKYNHVSLVNLFQLAPITTWAGRACSNEIYIKLYLAMARVICSVVLLVLANISVCVSGGRRRSDICSEGPGVRCKLCSCDYTLNATHPAIQLAMHILYMYRV